MKRKTISILSLLCVLTLLFSLCSCSSSISGKYRLKMIYAGDKLYEPGDQWNGEKLSKDSIIATVNDDHTLIIKITNSGSSVERKGVWYKIDDCIYTCFVDGESISIAVNGNTVIYKNSDTIIILKK